MDNNHTTGNSRLDTFLYIQSFLMAGLTSMVAMEAVLKTLLIGTGIALNMLGIYRHIIDHKKSKKDEKK